MYKEIDLLCQRITTKIESF